MMQNMPLDWRCLGAALVLSAASALPPTAAHDAISAPAEVDAPCAERVSDKCYEISADYPFAPHFVEVLGAKMHYVEIGVGDPILFVHGNPTWSYLWRNILPYASTEDRAIAVDLIGMGKSDKPDIEYRFADHAAYFNAFVEALDLRNITLVVHDWGSGIGLDFARRHPERVKAVVMMEAALGVYPDWDSFPAGARESFRAFRTDGVGQKLLMEDNLLVERVLPNSTARKLSGAEMEAYRAPFPTPASRKPIWRFTNEIPIAGEPADVNEAILAYVEWLQRTPTPKLLFHVDDGSLLPPARVAWAIEAFPNLTTIDLKTGGHFMQETHPNRIGLELQSWLRGRR